MHTSLMRGDGPAGSAIGEGAIPSRQPLTTLDTPPLGSGAASPSAPPAGDLLSDDDLEHVVGGLTRPLLDELARAPVREL